MSESKKTKIINLVCGPSGGKSCLAAQLFVELKLARKTVEYVQEYAKELVWTKKFRKLNDQFAVSEKQYSRFHAIAGHVEYIVTDGSLLHGLWYNRNNKHNLSNVEKTEEAIMEFYNEFDNVVIFLERGDFEYEQEGRIETEEEAHLIDKELQEILDEKDITYFTFKANLESDNLKKIVDFLLNGNIL